MFPYLDFALVAFVLFAGFGLGILLGLWLQAPRSRNSFDGDGGELVPMTGHVDAVAQADGHLAEVIPFRPRRAG